MELFGGQFSGLNCRLVWKDSPAVVAVEVVRVVGVVLKDQRLLVDDGVTLLADILAQAAGFLTVMARPTQVPEVRRGAESQQKSELSVAIYNVLLWNHDHLPAQTGCHRRGYEYTSLYLPAFLTKPTSASTAWQMSQQKQSGCQLLFMALMTRPMMNSPKGEHVTDQLGDGRNTFK